METEEGKNTRPRSFTSQETNYSLVWLMFTTYDSVTTVNDFLNFNKLWINTEDLVLKNE